MGPAGGAAAPCRGGGACTTPADGRVSWPPERHGRAMRRSCAPESGLSVRRVGGEPVRRVRRRIVSPTGRFRMPGSWRVVNPPRPCPVRRRSLPWQDAGHLAAAGHRAGRRGPERVDVPALWPGQARPGQAGAGQAGAGRACAGPGGGPDQRTRNARRARARRASLIARGAECPSPRRERVSGRPARGAGRGGGGSLGDSLRVGHAAGGHRLALGGRTRRGAGPSGIRPVGIRPLGS